MMRCKRCFKKYDGHDPECPRCGRLNEYDDDDGLDNLKDVEHSDTTSWFKNVKCEVCGKSSLSNTSNCPNCLNSNIMSNSRKSMHVDQRRIDSLVEDTFRTSRGKVDMLALSHEAGLINLDIDKWEAPFGFEYGKRMTAKSLLVMFGSFLFFSFFRLFETIEEALPFVIIMLLIGFIVLWYKKKSCVSGISISKLVSNEESVITYFKELKGKKGPDVFKLWSFDLETIDLVVKEGDKLQSIRFVEKANENGDQVNHQVYPIEFINTHDFITVILFFCYKYKIDLYIKDEVTSKIDSEAIS